MAVASGRLRAPAFASPVSRFRGRGAQVAGLLALMVVGYLLWKNEFPWPTSLTWQELPRKLDSAQEWLLEQRTEGVAVLAPGRVVERVDPGGDVGAGRLGLVLGHRAILSAWKAQGARCRGW